MRQHTIVFVVALVVAIAGAPLPAIEPEETGILNATSPEPGILFSGQPTAEQLSKLAASGYETVIDLRAPTEDRGYDEAAAANAAGLTYVPIPVTKQTIEDARTLDQFIRVFNETEKPVLVHCAGGGRVAAVYYAWLVSEKKMSRDEALARAKEEGLGGAAGYISPIDGYLDQEKSGKQ